MAKAKTPEGELKDTINTMLDASGVWWTLAIAGGYTNKKGIPDYDIVANRFKVTIEAKVPPNVVGGAQKRQMAALREQGVITLLVTPDNVEALPEFLSYLVQTKSLAEHNRLIETARRLKLAYEQPAWS